MIRRALTLLSLGCLLVAAKASAQDGMRTIPHHKAELGVHGGYMWTFSRDVWLTNTAGEADFEDKGFWGATLDLNMGHGKQGTLLYQRQETTLTFRPAGNPRFDVADIAVEYFQIGGLGGTPKGNYFPYGMFTLGATRVSASGGDDQWRFSFVFGAGAKAYFGQRLGLRLQGQIPFTFIDGGGSVACGSFGCVTTIGGTGVGQINLGGGLFMNF
jgi:hypothetical protein